MPNPYPSDALCHNGDASFDSCLRGETPHSEEGSCLSEEVVVHIDSGGRVSAARHPIVGPERVARYLLGIQRKFLPLAEVEIRPALLNGQPGFIGYRPEGGFSQEWLSALDEKRRAGVEVAGMRKTTNELIELYQAFKSEEPLFALVLTLAGRQIREVDMVANPDKLRHLPARS